MSPKKFFYIVPLDKENKWNFFGVLLIFYFFENKVNSSVLEDYLRITDENVLEINYIEKFALWLNNFPNFNNNRYYKFLEIILKYVDYDNIGFFENLFKNNQITEEQFLKIKTILEESRSKRLILPELKQSVKELDWKGKLKNFPPAKKVYFDGNYVVVQFAKGTKFYHGSSVLANGAVAYPAGIRYYDPVNLGQRKVELDIVTAADSPFTIESIISEYVPVDASWYASYETAKIYTRKDEQFPGCVDFCIHTYELKHDANFLLLNNDYNLLKISKQYPDIANFLQSMYSLKKWQLLKDDLNDDDVEKELIQKKLRYSVYETDLEFTKKICSNLILQNYAGYCSPEVPNDDGGFFHEEFVFCNPFLHLQRCYDDEKDMYYQNEKLIPKNLMTLLKQMEFYETINVNFHSGNLLEHSLWSLLFAEQICDNLKPEILNLNINFEKFKQLTAFAALIHDIGKMDPQMSYLNEKRKKRIFDVLKSHPEVGFEYAKNDAIPLLDENGQLLEKDTIKLSDIIKENIPFITAKEMNNIYLSILHHWYFGFYIMKKYFEDETLPKKAVEEYKNFFQNNKEAILMCLIVSFADILAAQPFSAHTLQNKTTDEIKTILTSQTLPFLKTRPKNYFGTNLVKQFDYNNLGYEVIRKIINGF